MDDREVVAAIAAGDPTGIAMAYDEYAAALYGYCHWVLRLPADAAEALRDTFVIAAATPGDLPQPPRLRPWLYSVARKECQRRLPTKSAADDARADSSDQQAGSGQRDAAAGQPADADGQLTDATLPIRLARQPADTDDQLTDATLPVRLARQPAAAADQLVDVIKPIRKARQPASTEDGLTRVNGDPEQAELRTLVRVILAELAPSEREIIELNLRHHLDDADLATALGVSWSQARAQAPSARGRLEKALGVLIIARTGREACPALNELLAGWDGKLDEQTRDLVAGHIEQCETCVGYRWGALRPVALSGLLPLVPLPPELRDQVLRLCSDSTPDVAAYRQRATRRAKWLWLARFAQMARRMRWSSIRRTPRPSTAAVVLGVWVLAVWVVSMALLIFTGSHTSHALVAQPTAKTPVSSPAAATTIAILPVTKSAHTSASARPSPTVSQPRSVLPPPVVPSPSPTENTKPSHSTKPSKSASPSPSKSASPKPSKSASSSPSPSRSASPLS